MLSVAAATALLRAATRFELLAPIADALGFEKRAERLTPPMRQRIGLPGEVTRASLVRGPGCLRALTLELHEGHAARTVLAQIASQLTRRTPDVLWLVMACTRGGAQLYVVVWARGERAPSLRTIAVDPHHVVASDADTLCSLAASKEGTDLLVHARWCDVLGRNALTRRFYLALRDTVHALEDGLSSRVARSDRRELALLCVSRLLFLSFLQAKGWLAGDHAFIESSYYACVADNGRFHARVLEPLFFGTLNTRVNARSPRARAFGAIPFLNGGLFARARVERRHRRATFDDSALGDLIGNILARYRFTPAEEIEDWSEAAIDPEILGRAFENLMESGDRKSSGSYYTPQLLVERVTLVALEAALGPDKNGVETWHAALAGTPLPPMEATELVGRVREIRILDPACGSGAFLVHVLRTLADIRVRYGGESASAARRSVLSNSVFGVDINPMAVWLCQLRLWLALAVECNTSDPMEVAPLPNLDRNVRVGDSLEGSAFAQIHQSRPSRVTTLRARYARAQGPRKRTFGRALDATERRAAIAVVDQHLAGLVAKRRDMLTALRSPDLFGQRSRGDRAESIRRSLRSDIAELRRERSRLCDGGALAFSFASHFPDVAAAGGFDAVVGNPPWVRPHNLPSLSRGRLRAQYATVHAEQWKSSAVSTARASQVDLASLFLQRSLELAKPGAPVSLLVPSKLWRTLAGTGVRRMVAERAQLLALEDFTAGAQLFNAAVYPSLVGIRRHIPERELPPHSVAVTVHRRDSAITWRTSIDRLGVTPDSGSPWMFVPPAVRRAFDYLTSAGVPLRESSFGEPRLGVKTGCNDAFVVRVLDRRATLSEVQSGDTRGWIESELLRPALRGETVAPWRIGNAREHIVWTHDRAGRPLSALPPRTREWLSQWRPTLAKRVDAVRAKRWWTLFRTAAASSQKSRVVWSDIGRQPRALVLGVGDPTVPLNTCYIVFAASDPLAHALAALLNSPLSAAWLNALAEPARGGYHRYLAWTMALLPMPCDERRLVDSLGATGLRAAAGETVSSEELLERALRAFRVRRAEVAPLLEWQDVS